MCGICGIADTVSMPPTSEAQLKLMRDRLTHRGPDDAGYHIADHVVLGSRRLAILDLTPLGHMPMSTSDGRYHIVYNGEIYNFQDFRPELKAKGYHFRSETDTEVLLYLYAEYGPKMLERLIGMFAIAIWDSVEKTLFLARDRLGIKPLVYTSVGDRFLFASEEKALFAAGIEPIFDEECWDELLYFRYVSGENTVYKSIWNLLPGHYLTWKNGHYQITRYWHLRERVEAMRGTIKDIEEWYRETLESAVRLRLISDVPVGVLLSGGLDSSTIATLAGQFNSSIGTFTVRFQDGFHDEGQLAKEVAEKNSLVFHELFVEQQGSLRSLISDASYLLDSPLVHGNDAHILAISRYAKKHVTVLLSGEGGDETLGGYVRYRPLQLPQTLYSLTRYTLPIVDAVIPKRSRLLKPRMRKLRRFLRQGGVNDFVLFNSCDVLPVDLADLGIKRKTPDLSYRRLILEEAKALYPGEPVRQAMYLDQHTFLQSLLARNDRMTMGASIECRVPFLDHRLVEGLASLPTSTFIDEKESKSLIRRIFGPVLPNSVLSHRKVGFSVPWGEYMRDATSFGRDVNALPDSGVVQSSPIPAGDLKRMIADFKSGDDRYMLMLRQFLYVDFWMNRLERHQNEA